MPNKAVLFAFPLPSNTRSCSSKPYMSINFPYQHFLQRSMFKFLSCFKKEQITVNAFVIFHWVEMIALQPNSQMIKTCHHVLKQYHVLQKTKLYGIVPLHNSLKVSSKMYYSKKLTNQLNLKMKYVIMTIWHCTTWLYT